MSYTHYQEYSDKDPLMEDGKPIGYVDYSPLERGAAPLVQISESEARWRWCQAVKASGINEEAFIREIDEQTRQVQA